MNLECSHSSSDQNMYNNDYKNIQLIKETCEDVFKKWNIGAEENASSSEIICGKNNLPKWTLMSLKPPATPCKEIVYAYFKVIEESLNGLVKLANHFWSTEKYFSEKNDFVISIGNKEIIDKLFVVISPNPFGSPHFVLLVMEPKKKVYCLYDPLGLNDNIVRDGVAINQSIEYAK
uniref:Ubiquitin-like protease family profile domain-containing protein n=1 Tax=Panagrolaimus superbus TaxID=310955 RepID=A0A914YKA7_9BILA